MKRLVQELQQRGVLRATGLYIALAWLLLQVADVVFPAFDIPDSVLRYALYAAFAGLPLVIIAAWFYEITPEGILTEQEVRAHGNARSGTGALTGLTISALALALGISVFVNLQQSSDKSVEPPRMVSILVADFDNETGDPLFDGSLEAALTIGLEGATFISSYARHAATRIAEQITSKDSLSEESARLVSVREGVDLVLSGKISQTSEGYRLSQRAINPVAGELVAEAEATAKTKAEILPAVGALAAQIREGLGDLSLKDGNLAASETFTAASLAAVQYYTQAQTHAFREENVEAIEYFSKAVEEDPDFGRAYTGWALSEMKLGRREKSEELWNKALALIDSMTERERYRTLGIYYTVVTGNQRKAIENYKLLVDKYPADGIGWNNLGVGYFYTLQFDLALEVGAQLVELFPGNPAFRANYALFAMYAGDFDVARKEAELLLEQDPGYFLAYLPPAMADIYAGKLGEAEDTYKRMGEHGQRARSMSITGLADIALLAGDYARAEQLLREGQASDLESGNSEGHAYKGIYRARALAAMGDVSQAVAALEQAVPGNNAISHLVPAALLYIEMGDPAPAREIQQQLATRLQQGHRAAADMLNGALALAGSDTVNALNALNASLERTDSWFTRYYLGRAYAEAGEAAKALAEFERCMDRIGESAALYLDDIPTSQYHAPLYYWLGRTRQQLGQEKEALADLDRYLSFRVSSDNSTWTADARDRHAAISSRQSG